MCRKANINSFHGFDRSQLFSMESLRRKELHRLATSLQAIYKGWSQRQKFLRMKHAQTVLSSNWRAYRVHIYI